MKKVLLILDSKTENTPILNEFFKTLYPLVNIKGFYLETLTATNKLKINLFSKKTATHNINLNIEPVRLNQEMEPFIEDLLSELSMFDLVDVFLLDKLGTFEIHIPRLRQQIITVFYSRIPVIATVRQNDVSKLSYILDHFPLKIVHLSKFAEKEVFSNLIRELYDI